MVSYSDYTKEWGQSLIIGTLIAFSAVLLFVGIGGIDFGTERGRLALFLFAFTVGMISVYLALFKWKKNIMSIF